MLYDDNGAVKGVATGNMGVGKDGQPTDNFQPGVELHGKYTLFAEGARGHLGKQVIAKFRLDAGRDPQTWGIGIKEIWEVPPDKFKAGRVVHSIGWPLEPDTYGGGWMYHFGENLVSVGFVVGLGYSNPYLSPFEEFQRYKTHPLVRATLEGGKRLEYGSRAINASGLQSLPKLVFPGGALVGCDAGFLNAPRIKGSHAAIKSGMLAADAAFEALAAGRQRDELAAYPQAFEVELAARRTASRAQLQAAARQGALLGRLPVRHRPDRVPRQGAVDAAPEVRRPREAEAGVAVPADRLSEARRQAHASTASRRCTSRTRTTRRTSRRT